MTSAPTPSGSVPEQGPGAVDTQALLHWRRGTESVDTVVLACQDAPATPGPHDTAVVRWPGCLDEQALRLAPQLLADGAAAVRLRWCPGHGTAPARKASQAARADQDDDAADQGEVLLPGDTAPSSLTVWSHVLGGLLQPDLPASRSLRHGPVLSARAVPVPRRALVGAHLEGRLDLDLDDQDRVVQALRILLAQGRILAPGSDLAGLPAAGRVLTASGCTLCAACTWACPHGALQVAEADSGARGLVQDLAACRGCLACVSACPVDALTADEATSLARVWEAEALVLAADHPRTCARCGARYSEDLGGPATHDVGQPTSFALAPTANGQDEDPGLCPLCRARERSPFLTELPPEAERALPPSVLAAIRRSRGLS
ncbi:4Fe-4S dicluster domain-containing protein [Actinomyces faecalis]|uniref:4Fe-4S dicluster domain-containing protein n=1 Tax=Actinomyces faecalis TaxID=2722820 RepID=UPI001556D4BC|nr:4Fe-4S dicluster domain-containing protein [Actinomyces faecalis]